MCLTTTSSFALSCSIPVIFWFSSKPVTHMYNLVYSCMYMYLYPHAQCHPPPLTQLPKKLCKPYGKSLVPPPLHSLPTVITWTLHKLRHCITPSPQMCYCRWHYVVLLPSPFLTVFNPLSTEISPLNPARDIIHRFTAHSFPHPLQLFQKGLHPRKQQTQQQQYSRAASPGVASATTDTPSHQPVSSVFLTPQHN